MQYRRAVVIYDGDWALWLRFARWVHRRDHGARLELISLQEPGLDARFPRISRQQCRDALHLIDENGKVLTGAAAVRETLTRLSGSALIALPFRVPGGMWIANGVYRWVARNRGWLSRWFDWKQPSARC